MNLSIILVAYRARNINDLLYFIDLGFKYGIDNRNSIL